MRLLKHIIAYLVNDTLQEAVPEANVGDIFGAYLWADKKSAPIRTDKVPNEKNTKEEIEFFSSLSKYIYHDLSSNFKAIISIYLRPLKMKGKYLKFIAPPKQTVYRGLHNVSIPKTAKLLNISEEAVRKAMVSGDLIKISATIGGDKHVASWTIDKNVANIFASYKRNSMDEVGIVLITNPYYNSNDFYLNPRNLSKSFEALNRLEAETISYGPVEIKYAYLFGN